MLMLLSDTRGRGMVLEGYRVSLTLVSDVVFRNSLSCSVPAVDGEET